MNRNPAAFVRDAAMVGAAAVRSALRDSGRMPALRASAARLYKSYVYRRLGLVGARFGESCGGEVELVETGRIAGWAADASHPERELEIDVHAGDTRLTTARAALFREDLRRAGVGDGNHGFESRIFARGELRHPGSVSVRIRGTDVHLRYRGRESFRFEPLRGIEYIAADIVDNCNLRCPFCVVDYSGVRKTELMSEATFRNLLKLVRSVPTAGFWLSCLHEPTLHPRLDDFIDLIPRDCREKAWFTTNLARPIGDETFERWARSGLHHINVSLDTLDEKLFPVLRKFGRFEVFRDNLERLAGVFRAHEAPPPLRYITVAFRSNFDEIPGLIAHSHERLLSSENEIRYTLNVEHITDEFRRDHFLRKDDWPVLTDRLRELPYRHVIFCPPPTGYEEDLQPSANYFRSAKATRGAPPPRCDHPLGLRVAPDGTILVVGKETVFSVNVGDLDDPVAFFSSL